MDMSSWGLDRQAMMRGATGGVVKSQFQKDGLTVHRRRADDSCKAEAEEGVNRGLRRRRNDGVDEVSSSGGAGDNPVMARWDASGDG